MDRPFKNGRNIEYHWTDFPGEVKETMEQHNISLYRLGKESCLPDYRIGQWLRGERDIQLVILDRIYGALDRLTGPEGGT